MRLRPGLRLWHRWFGLVCGGWLVLLAVTGMAIAWYEEIDAALNPELRRVAAASGPPAPMDVVIARSEAALPGFAPNNIILAHDPGDTHLLLGRQSLPDGGARAMQVFADPASGAVLGSRESGALVLDRKHLPDLVYGLHVDLLAGEAGAWFVGIVAMLWLIDHFLALPLALPKGARFADALRMTGRSGSLRRLFDWHRAKAMWSWIGTFLLALTSVTLTFPEASRAVMRTALPVSERLHDTMPEVEPAGGGIGVDAAIAAVTADPSQLHSIRLHPEHGVYAIRTYHPRDPDDQGRLWTYVSIADGTIAGTRHDMGEGPADAFFALQYPLHSGRVAGDAGRIVVTLLGVAIVWLAVSGLQLLWRRRRIGRVVAG